VILVLLKLAVVDVDRLVLDEVIRRTGVDREEDLVALRADRHEGQLVKAEDGTEGDEELVLRHPVREGRAHLLVADALPVRVVEQRLSGRLRDEVEELAEFHVLVHVDDDEVLLLLRPLGEGGGYEHEGDKRDGKRPKRAHSEPFLHEIFALQTIRAVCKTGNRPGFYVRAKTPWGRRALRQKIGRRPLRRMMTAAAAPHRKARMSEPMPNPDFSRPARRPPPGPPARGLRRRRSWSVHLPQMPSRGPL
jgi:hypothetical protein